LSVEGEKYLINCLFPGKIEYNDDRYRTLLVSDIAHYVYLKTKNQGQKKGRNLLKRLRPTGAFAFVDRFYLRFNAPSKPKGKIMEIDPQLSERKLGL